MISIHFSANAARVTVTIEALLSRTSMSILRVLCQEQQSCINVFVATSSCSVAIFSHSLVAEAIANNDSAMTGQQMLGNDKSVTLFVFEGKGAKP